MCRAKESIIRRMEIVSDELDELEILQELYILARLEHSLERCEREGTISGEELMMHFREKEKRYAN